MGHRVNVQLTDMGPTKTSTSWVLHTHWVISRFRQRTNMHSCLEKSDKDRPRFGFFKGQHLHLCCDLNTHLTPSGSETQEEVRMSSAGPWGWREEGQDALEQGPGRSEVVAASGNSLNSMRTPTLPHSRAD